MIWFNLYMYMYVQHTRTLQVWQMDPIALNETGMARDVWILNYLLNLKLEDLSRREENYEYDFFISPWQLHCQYIAIYVLANVLYIRETPILTCIFTKVFLENFLHYW